MNMVMNLNFSRKAGNLMRSRAVSNFQEGICSLEVNYLKHENKLSSFSLGMLS